MRTRINAARCWLVFPAIGVAQIAREGLGPGDRPGLAGVVGISHFREVEQVTLHEDVAIRTVARAQAATNAMVLNDDLHVLAAVDRIDRATDHAISILTRTT